MTSGHEITCTSCSFARFSTSINAMTIAGGTICAANNATNSAKDFHQRKASAG
jgi:hypothetical protein